MSFIHLFGKGEVHLCFLNQEYLHISHTLIKCVKLKAKISKSNIVISLPDSDNDMQELYTL